MSIVVKFEPGENRKCISGELEQWDTGQSLAIYGITDAQEVHWAQEGKGETTAVLAEQKEGYIEVEIPDLLLTESRNLYGYIYTVDGGSGETQYTIYMTVNPRAKPEDYTEPGNRNILQQIIQKLNKKADGLQVEEDRLQLLSGKTPIGNEVKLPQGGGTGENIESITNQEIDEIMKGEQEDAEIS